MRISKELVQKETQLKDNGKLSVTEEPPLYQRIISSAFFTTYAMIRNALVLIAIYNLYRYIYKVTDILFSSHAFDSSSQISEFFCRVPPGPPKIKESFKSGLNVCTSNNLTDIISGVYRCVFAVRTELLRISLCKVL